jgi:hypothetical protein
MNFFKKESTIEFFSIIPEVAHLAPIQPANNFRPNLIVNASKALSQAKKDSEYGYSSYNSTAKCPGLYNLVKHGWVMTAWTDITIETNGDGVSFKWESAANQKNIDGGIAKEAVAYHTPEQYADFVEDDPNTLKTIVKINTPWRCIVPKGYYLQEGPLPYTDEKRFTVVKGYFNREYGVAQLNVQLLWHVMNGKTLIKAGTPIAHYVLVPIDQPKLVIMEATPEQLKANRLTELEIARKFISKKSESKCVFSKYFLNK